MTFTKEVSLTQLPKSVVPSDHEMMVFQTMAKQAVASKLYRGIGDEFAVMTIMLAARELDIPPMAALNGGINIINGKTEISARMMAGLIVRRGHILKVVESTHDQCTLEGIRRDTNVKACETFHIDEAKQAGLIREGGGWKKWPKDMCYARCLSRLARRLFPDVIGMGYIEGEIREKDVHPVVPENDMDMSVMVEEPSLEETLKKEQELLKNFLSQFANDESEKWNEYIQLIREKLDLSIKQIIDKYNENPTLATEKFQTWIGKRSKQA